MFSTNQERIFGPFCGSDVFCPISASSLIGDDVPGGDFFFARGILMRKKWLFPHRSRSPWCSCATLLITRPFTQVL